MDFYCRRLRNSLDVWELAADLLHNNGQVADFVLVDPQGGEAGHVGELNMRAVVIAVQDECAELLQTAQKSWVPLATPLRTIT